MEKRRPVIFYNTPDTWICMNDSSKWWEFDIVNLFLLLMSFLKDLSQYSLFLTSHFSRTSPALLLYLSHISPAPLPYTLSLPGSLPISYTFVLTRFFVFFHFSTTLHNVCHISCTVCIIFHISQCVSYITMCITMCTIYHSEFCDARCA